MKYKQIERNVHNILTTNAKKLIIVVFSNRKQEAI